MAYLQSNMDFIAKEQAPILPVEKAADVYRVYNPDTWAYDEMKAKAVGERSTKIEYDFSEDMYVCKDYGAHTPVYDRLRNEADFLNQERNAVQTVMRAALMKFENIIGNFFSAGAGWGTTITGVNASPGADQVLKWSVAGSDPIRDIYDQKVAILKATGFEPNTLTITPDVLTVLIRHDVIKETMIYGGTPGQPAIARVPALEAIFMLDRVLVSKAVKQAALRGSDAATLKAGRQFVLSGALLSYINRAAPSQEVPSAIYSFADTSFGEPGEMARLRTWREDDIEATQYEATMSLDAKITGPKLGVYFNAII
jgi:hypothetical protein